MNAGLPPEPGKLLRVVPDLVVEILSPSNAMYDRVEKRDIYRKNRVREYWLVDPGPREITVLVLDDNDGDDYAIHGTFGPGATVTSMVLPDFRASVSELFA